MKLSKAISLMTAFAMMAAPCSTAVALPPPPGAPFTLWNFLGIPQGFNKLRDATSNAKGNRPGMERKPALKALADPQNLMSTNPAIAKAAEIKTQEDMAPQKIKAIKYLASVGCGCYAGVKEALMAALDDCTEEVRFQTVLAIEEAAGNHCETCNKNCCCDEDLVLKLSQIAYEKTDKCCWLESSERVREAAKAAMCACCPGQGPVGETIESPPPVDNEPERANEPTPPGPEGEDVNEASIMTDAATGMVLHENRTKLVVPQGDAMASDLPHETEEIVTVEFGGPASRRSLTPAATARRSNSSTKSASATPSMTMPASQRRSSPKSGPIHKPTSTTRPAGPALPAVDSGAHLGPSSRRAAQERGLAATPVQTPAVQTVSATQAPPASTLANPLKSLLWFDGDQRPAARPVGSAAQTASSAAPRQHVHGTVARISKDAGTVELRFDQGAGLKPGDKLQVTHEYLLEQVPVAGALEVISVGPRGVTARGVGGLTLDKISRGDDAVFNPSAAGNKGAAPTAAKPQSSARDARLTQRQPTDHEQASVR